MAIIVEFEQADLSLEERAYIFATRAHRRANQVRKYTGEPYIMHPAAVVDLIKSVPHTPEMVAAAWLHDTVEDTAVTIADIRAAFGPDVALLVWWLTDYSTPADGNRAQRKAFYREHIAKASPAAKTIKLADIIDNTQSIVQHDPEFAKVYLQEKRELLKALVGGDRTLADKAYVLVLQGLRSLNIN